MVVYFVRWDRGDTPIKSHKGRHKIDSAYYSCTVLCRNSKDALSCFEYLFKTEFERNTGIEICDGDLIMKRLKLDSRNFTVQYLMMDGIKRPLCLADLKQSLYDVSRLTHP